MRSFDTTDASPFTTTEEVQYFDVSYSAAFKPIKGNFSIKYFGPQTHIGSLSTDFVATGPQKVEQAFGSIYRNKTDVNPPELQEILGLELGCGAGAGPRLKTDVLD